MSRAFDLVVVGAGPGGMAAASVAAGQGCRVLLIDSGTGIGGQVWRGLRLQDAASAPHGRSFAHWAGLLSHVEVQIGCEVVDQPAPGILLLAGEGRSEQVYYGKLIVATGARERMLPFPGWTLPGVIGAGAAHALLKSGLSLAGKRVVVAGSGPLLLASAAALARSGARVLQIVEQARLSRLAGMFSVLCEHPSKLLEGAVCRWQTLGAGYRTGSWVTAAEGDGHLRAVQIRSGGKEQRVECDLLACGYNLVPNLELPRLLGCRIEQGVVLVDRLRQSSLRDVYCIGELTGVGGMEKAILEGRIAAYAACGAMEKAAQLIRQLPREERFVKQLSSSFALREELRTLAGPQDIFCRCEDVRMSVATGCSNARDARLHARIGMGACQGRTCGSAAEFLFGWQASTPRSPVFPVAAGALLAELSEPEGSASPNRSEQH